MSVKLKSIQKNTGFFLSLRSEPKRIPFSSSALIKVMVLKMEKVRGNIGGGFQAQAEWLGQNIKALKPFEQESILGTIKPWRPGAEADTRDALTLLLSSQPMAGRKPRVLSLRDRTTLTHPDFSPHTIFQVSMSHWDIVPYSALGRNRCSLDNRKRIKKKKSPLSFCDHLKDENGTTLPVGLVFLQRGKPYTYSRPYRPPLALTTLHAYCSASSYLVFTSPGSVHSSFTLQLQFNRRVIVRTVGGTVPPSKIQTLKS